MKNRSREEKLNELKGELPEYTRRGGMGGFWYIIQQSLISSARYKYFKYQR